MKVFLTLFALSISLFAEVDVKGDISLQEQAFLKKDDTKNDNAFDIASRLEGSLKKGDLSFKSNLYLQKNEDDKRSFVRLDEAFMEIDFENDKVSFGKMIKFWGALEVYNIANIFNYQDGRNDAFSDDRVGSWAMSYTHFYDTSTLSFLIKLYEPRTKQATPSYVYALSNVNDELQSEKSLYRPTFYAIYSGYGDEELSYDYAFIFQNGYDFQRYFSFDTTSNSLYENAYLVNKLTTYDTLVIGDTLYKLEASITDVIDDMMVQDYYQFGVGFEHTLSGLYAKKSL